MNRTDTLDFQTERMWADTAAWFSSHSLQILLGLAAGTAIVVALMGARWIGLRICRTDPTHLHWRTVFGRMLERTRFWFMLALAARVVITVGQAPEPWGRVTQVAFIVAMALQAALWARELALGVIEHRAGAHEDSSGLGSAMGIIRLLVSIAIFAIALVVVLDNLGVNVTGLIAGPRHRRHRHRPRRAGHLQGSVRRAGDHLRPAVPPRRRDPVRGISAAMSRRSASSRPASAPIPASS